MFIQLTAYGHSTIINTDHIVQMWPEKKYNKPDQVAGHKVVTRIQLTNSIIDVAESYDEVVDRIDNA